MKASNLVHELLVHSAEADPASTALISGSMKMSYGELDEATNKVANTLRARGVSKGDRVGIYVHKSLASAISVYGIMKAGAAYVPLDPSAPAQRLAYIIKDSGIRVLLTSTKKAGDVESMFPEESPLDSVILIDPDAEQGMTSQGNGPEGLSGVVPWPEVLDTEPSLPPQDGITETDLSYILYTSGSTGVPKGVMISHRNCLTFVNWAGQCAGLTSSDHVSSHAPIHFDLSTFDLYSTCGAGAAVVLVPEKASTFPVELVKLIERERISVWYSVPSVLTLMSLYGNIDGHDLSSLRNVVFAGEVFPTKYLRGLMAKLPSAKFFNWYGPTETNVCTYYQVPVLPEEMTAPIPIGKACENTDAFGVSDDGLRVEKPGDEGELYVRGPSVMQGYWGDQGKSDRVLVRNPFNKLFDETVYRTGDIVTVDGEGNYIYLGRKDGMIKTRGYRVELGEIESVMYSHPQVKEAAAFPVPDEIVGNLIRVVITPLERGKLSREELLGYMGQKLPKYMIPDYVEFRESLPRTSTGKVDRVALAKDFVKK